MHYIATMLKCRVVVCFVNLTNFMVDSFAQSKCVFVYCRLLMVKLTFSQEREGGGGYIA